MNYRSRTKGRRWGQFTIVLLLCITIGYFASRKLALPLSQVGHYVDELLYSLLPQGFRKSADLAKENETLRQQILILSAENADRKMLFAENAELKLGLGRVLDSKPVHATILKKPPVSPYDTFVLDVGTNNGVTSGDTVAFGNLVIGEIIDVGTSYSKARLFSSPGNVFQGTIGEENISIEAKGIGGGAFEALVPIGANVEEGNTLILPSISPKVFGYVERTEDLTDEGFKKIFFTLPINLNQIGAVSIVK